MPKKSKARRSRYVPNWCPILWSAFWVNTAFGLILSPITATTKVYVRGAPEGDQTRITACLKRLANRPFFQTDLRLVESLVQQGDAVRSSELAHNIFGTARLTIWQHMPVGNFTEPKSLALSKEGVPFYTSVPNDELVEISLPANVLGPSLCLASGWECGKIALLCQLVSERLPKDRWRVELKEGGVISLYGSGPISIILGSSDDLTKKVSLIEGLLRDRPDFVHNVKEINLTSPENPVFVPKKPESNKDEH